ncbi:hypothetical protein BWI93_02550 [Siphonobacter sp. BAB-5385]|uniref:hypothetical protein n=1 Tax=Siphonobacter sp. BAB-5385 TaxID=1864822 RepID=UPI000B9EA30D|nr:hypothetical protein [Siphonobacter sp. BAB-5385]OZI09764.1 hypothetical protein BWI93_02550 [Siphonobacter sp. BAB-5385]
MKSIPNITGDLEAIVRLSGASFLVPFMLYTEWMLFVRLPFDRLIPVLTGYDPLKALVRKLFSRKAACHFRTMGFLCNAMHTGLAKS